MEEWSSGTSENEIITPSTPAVLAAPNLATSLAQALGQPGGAKRQSGLRLITKVPFYKSKVSPGDPPVQAPQIPLQVTAATQGAVGPEMTLGEGSLGVDEEEHDQGPGW